MTTHPDDVNPSAGPEKKKRRVSSKKTQMEDVKMDTIEEEKTLDVDKILGDWIKIQTQVASLIFILAKKLNEK